MHRNHLKHSDFENLYFRYITWAPNLRNHQKLPKNQSLNRDLLNFFLDMVYIRWYLVNPYVQRVQKMSKGVGPRTITVVRIKDTPPIFVREVCI